MQRFVVALFAVLALLVIAFPLVDARATGLRRSETNADRLRRGEPPLPPAKLKRYPPSRVEVAKRNRPSSYPYGGPPPPPPYGGGLVGSGSIQCRGGDGTTIGYVGYTDLHGLTVPQGSTSGLYCSLFADGELTFDGGKPGKRHIGAPPSNPPFTQTSTGSTLLTDTFKSENVVSWILDAPTGQLTPEYKTTGGNSFNCTVNYDVPTGNLTCFADPQAPTNPVTLYLV